MSGDPRRRVTALAAAVLLIAGCGSNDSAGDEPTASSTGPTGSGDFVVEPPDGYCKDWLVALEPINHDQVEYVGAHRVPGGPKPGGADFCEIDTRQVPEAAANGLDVVRLTLEFGDTTEVSFPTDELAVLEDPIEPGTVEWDRYLDETGQTPLRGDLACWNDDDDCETSGEIDGQSFRYVFRATHRNLYLGAHIQYLTPETAEKIEETARRHALDLFQGYVTAVTTSLPRE